MYSNRLLRPTVLALIFVLSISAHLGQAYGQVNVLTNKYSNSRLGANTAETLLAPSNVNSNQFGKLFTFNVDGYIQAQPLYMSGVTINGGTHNVVFVATMHDSIYAIDADTGALFWQVSFINTGAGIMTVPMAVQGCGNITKLNEVGILSTPVIDAGTGTIYVVAKTQETVGTTTSYYFRLHALDITTGAEKFGGPAVISASSGALNLNPKAELQRPALLSTNGTLYLAFGSNGCDLTGRGWLLAYSPSTLQQLGAMVTQPDGSYGSAIWQGGTGPAADADGNIYLSTANGEFNFGTNFPDLGDSVLKLNFNSGAFTVADYFTPYDEAVLSSQDLDLGSGAVSILPDQTGRHKHLLATGSKRGDVYLLDGDNLGQFNMVDNSQIPQYMPGALSKYNFSSPNYWTDGTNQYVYYLAHNDFLKAYSLSNGALSATPVAQTSTKLTTVGLPEISANGTANGIVWIVRSVNGIPLLSAYEASKLFLLYDSGMAANGRDSLGTVAHFAPPTIANGKVYAGTQTQLVVYGLFSQINTTSGNNQSGNAGSTLLLPLTVTATNPYTGAPIPGITVTFNDGNKGGTFSNPTAVTDGSGIASTNYTLPNKPQTLTITAMSPGFAPVTFTEQDNVGPVATLTVVSGGKQTGTVGTTLPAALVVKAKDAVGNVVPNASITFADGGAGGAFIPNPAITDSTGQASTSYTLPFIAKALTVTAQNGSVSVNISEKSVPGPAFAVNIVQGNNQSAHPNNKLPKALIVSVTDQYNNGITGLAVHFTDNGAGGSFSLTDPVTAAGGKATTIYTTGPNTGTVTITATYSTLPAAVFTETVF